jgi:hypothetical protein
MYVQTLNTVEISVGSFISFLRRLLKTAMAEFEIRWHNEIFRES